MKCPEWDTMTTEKGSERRKTLIISSLFRDKGTMIETRNVYNLFSDHEIDGMIILKLISSD